MRRRATIVLGLLTSLAGAGWLSGCQKPTRAGTGGAGYTAAGSQSSGATGDVSKMRQGEATQYDRRGQEKGGTGTDR